MTRPENAALERQFWVAVGGLGPTGSAVHVGAYIQGVLGTQWHRLHPTVPTNEACAALLHQARKAYDVVGDLAKARYDNERKTSARIRIIRAFARGEPLVGYDPWINALQFEARMQGNKSLLDGINAALWPRLPTVRNGKRQQRIKAQEYYRWVIARVSERLLANKKMTITAAIRAVVLGSDEAEERRKRAGLTSGLDPDKDPEPRARQIYYHEVKRYVWRVIVAAGVGHVESSQASNQIAGFHPRGVTL
jgi:hypothetical protein